MRVIELVIPFDEILSKVREDIQGKVVFTSAEIDNSASSLIVEAEIQEDEANFNYLRQNHLLRGI